MSKNASKSNDSEKSTAFATSFEKTAKDRAALSAGELLTINLDVPSTFISVLAAVPRINAMRDAIVTDTPTIDLHQIDKLESYAQALGEANGLYLAASQPTELPALMNRATELHALLVSDATALANRGFIDPKLLADLRGTVGYVNISTDLNTLYQLFQGSRRAIAGKSAVSEAELEEAHAIFEKMSAALAGRELQSQTVTIATDDRQRAFTLLVNAYDQARRALSFLRWSEDDVEKIAPSLWSGRGRRAGSDVQPAAPVVTPAAPVVAPVVAPPVAPPVAPAAPGMPGGSPFVPNGTANH